MRQVAVLKVKILRLQTALYQIVGVVNNQREKLSNEGGKEE
jgi:hypothetical protein